MNILFFGSTTDSVLVLDKLPQGGICAVVTQPPRPIGRNQEITPTPVELWAKEHTIPVLTFQSNKEKSWLYENEQTVIDTLEPFQADLIVSASYGQKIPSKTIADAAFRGLNIHPSILPRWRGADPVPWAILDGDKQIGVTIVTLSEQFDEGKIIAQQKIPILDTDMSDPLRTRLFDIGATLLAQLLHENKGGAFDGPTQKKSDSPYARKLTRQDGFEPWEQLQLAMTTPQDASRIDRKFRAFMPWPGLWTQVCEKRLKIISCHLSNSSLILDTVQLEGKQPVSFDQFASAYHLT